MELVRLTKKEAIAEIMYNVSFHDSADFEVDEESFSINKDGGYWLKGINTSIYCENKTDLRKAVSQLGKNILVL